MSNPQNQYVPGNYSSLPNQNIYAPQQNYQQHNYQQQNYQQQNYQQQQQPNYSRNQNQNQNTNYQPQQQARTHPHYQPVRTYTRPLRNDEKLVCPSLYHSLDFTCKQRLCNFFGLESEQLETTLEKNTDSARLATLGDAWLNLIVLESLLPTEDPSDVKSLFARNEILGRFMLALFEHKHHSFNKHRLGDMFEACLYLSSHPNAIQEWSSMPTHQGVEKARKCVFALKRWVLSAGKEKPILKPLDIPIDLLSADIAVYVPVSVILEKHPEFAGILPDVVAVRSRGVQNVFDVLKNICFNDDAKLAEKQEELDRKAIDDIVGDDDGEENNGENGLRRKREEDAEEEIDVKNLKPIGAGGEAVASVANQYVLSGDRAKSNVLPVGPSMPRNAASMVAAAMAQDYVNNTIISNNNNEASVSGGSVSSARKINALEQDTSALLAAQNVVLNPVASFLIQQQQQQLNSTAAPRDGSFLMPEPITPSSVSNNANNTNNNQQLQQQENQNQQAALLSGSDTENDLNESRSASTTSTSHGGIIAGGGNPTLTHFPSASPAPLDPGSQRVAHPRPAITVTWVSRSGAKQQTRPFFPCCGLEHDSRRNCRLPAFTGKWHPGTIIQGRQTRTAATKVSCFAHWSCCSRPLVSTGAAGVLYQVTPEMENGCQNITATSFPGHERQSQINASNFYTANPEGMTKSASTATALSNYTALTTSALAQFAGTASGNGERQSSTSTNLRFGVGSTSVHRAVLDLGAIQREKQQEQGEGGDGKEQQQQEGRLSSPAPIGTNDDNNANTDDASSQQRQPPSALHAFVEQQHEQAKKEKHAKKLEKQQQQQQEEEDSINNEQEEQSTGAGRKRVAKYKAPSH